MQTIPKVTGKTEALQLTTEKFQLSIVIIEKLIVLVKAVGDSFTKLKEFLIELRRDRIVESIDRINELIINRTLMTEMRKLGLGSDWLKLVLDEKESLIWLKNIHGVYVAINNKLFKELGLEHYSQILGATSNEVYKKVERNNIYISTIEDADLTDKLSLEKGISISNITSLNDLDKVELNDKKLSILKYVIKNNEGVIIAVFGMAKIADGTEDGVRSIKEPKKHLIEFLKILEENS